jgi:hypothetical protein
MRSRLNDLASLCVVLLLLTATVDVLGQSPIDLTGSRRGGPPPPGGPRVFFFVTKPPGDV